MVMSDANVMAYHKANQAWHGAREAARDLADMVGKVARVVAEWGKVAGRTPLHFDDLPSAEQLRAADRNLVTTYHDRRRAWQVLTEEEQQSFGTQEL
jgi:hypothetical protein